MNKKKKVVDNTVTDELSDDRIEQAVFELSQDARYWPYLVEYFSKRISIAENSLYALDPFKNPTEVARCQGIRSGLLDLISFAEAVDTKHKKAIEDGTTAKKRQSEEEAGGSYGKW